MKKGGTPQRIRAPPIAPYENPHSNLGELIPNWRRGTLLIRLGGGEVEMTSGVDVQLLLRAVVEDLRGEIDHVRTAVELRQSVDWRKLERLLVDLACGVGMIFDGEAPRERRTVSEPSQRGS